MAKTKAWLRCIITPGTVEGEYSIKGIDHTRREFRSYAGSDECKIITNNGAINGLLRVDVIDVDKRYGIVLVELPQPIEDNGHRVNVHKSSVVYD